ncbi:MAG: hypothetical protein H0V81_08705 [Solirubrobacterales bacterium]|nr:hypothetical protein [Solirubrobacterales bacterium]
MRVAGLCGRALERCRDRPIGRAAFGKDLVEVVGQQHDALWVPVREREQKVEVVWHGEPVSVQCGLGLGGGLVPRQGGQFERPCLPVERALLIGEERPHQDGWLPAKT